MSISRQDFNLHCINFVNRCQGLGEEWFVSRYHQGKFLDIDDMSMICVEDEQLVLVKTHIEVNDETKDIRTHEFSIVYSESYKVPVMYFSSSDQDGKPLGLDGILSSSKVCDQTAAQAISQVEHPLLFRPFYMVHPCKTKNFMEAHKKNDPKNYLLSWLSVVGTLLNLNLDPRLAYKSE